MPQIQDEKVLVSTHDRDEQGKQIDAEEKVAEIQLPQVLPLSGQRLRAKSLRLAIIRLLPLHPLAIA